jgi:hypothetical protein
VIVGDHDPHTGRRHTRMMPERGRLDDEGWHGAGEGRRRAGRPPSGDRPFIGMTRVSSQRRADA